MYIYTYIYTYVFLYVHTYIYICVHVHIFIDICVYMYIHIYIYMHIYVYIHVYQCFWRHAAGLQCESPKGCVFLSPYPPVSMNHAKTFKGWPPEMPLWSWYNCGTLHFHLTDFCQVEMKNPTRLSNKTSIAWSYAEDQILEN